MSLQLDEDYNYAKRQLPDGRWLYVIPLTYGRARICVGSRFNPLIFDDGW